MAVNRCLLKWFYSRKYCFRTKPSVNLHSFLCSRFYTKVYFKTAKWQRGLGSFHQVLIKHPVIQIPSTCPPGSCLDEIHLFHLKFVTYFHLCAKSQGTAMAQKGCCSFVQRLKKDYSLQTMSGCVKSGVPLLFLLSNPRNEDNLMFLMKVTFINKSSPLACLTKYQGQS